jgi:excisionase family DNA binding protein
MDCIERRRIVVELLALTISQAAKLGGPCRSALYQDIRDGRLRAVKRGRSTRILLEDFKAYLASFPTVQSVTNPKDPSVGVGDSERRVSSRRSDSSGQARD